MTGLGQIGGAEAVQAIGQRGFTEAATALRQAARNPEPAVRLAAIRALGQVVPTFNGW